MTGYDYLNIQASAFAGKTSTKPISVNLYKFLTSNKYADKVDYIRKGATLEQIKERKNKASLPSITVSAILKGGRSENHVVSHTNLMCIDIDRKDNIEIIEKVPDILKSLPYVAFFQKSVSGQGYYAIIPIQNGENHLQHFLALEDEFAGMGIRIDKSCKNVARLRFYSYDGDRYLADNVSVYTKIKEPPSKVAPTTARLSHPSSPSKTIGVNDKELIKELDVHCKEISDNKVVVCTDYNSWFQVGCALANELGEAGRRYFQLLSEPYSGYDKVETDNKYDECLHNCGKYSYSKGTVFHYVKQALKN